MRTDLRCRHCQTRLSVKAELQGKQICCPKCRQPVRVTLAPVVLPQLVATAPSSSPQPERAQPLEDEPLLAEVVDFDVVPDEAPESAPEETPRPKKKRKKKKKVEVEASYPAWLWGIMIFGALFTTAGLIFGIYLAMRAGTPDCQPVAWKQQLLVFGISVPITLVILILSMFISSALGGGINFGDAKTAIIGSLFLIVIVNVVNLIPIVGRYLTLLVWLIGFMTIFGLDPWEARFLLFINWLLNYALGFAMFHYMANKYDLGDDDDDEPVRSKPRDGKKKFDRRREREDPDDLEEMGYYSPGRWHDQVSQWVEAQRRIA